MIQATAAIADFMLILIHAGLWVGVGIAGLAASALLAAGATYLILRGIARKLRERRR